MQAAADPLLSRASGQVLQRSVRAARRQASRADAIRDVRFRGLPPVQYLSCVLEQRSDASATQEVSEPMPHEDRADLAQARQLAGRAEEPGDHWLLFALLRLALLAQCIRDACQ